MRSIILCEGFDEILIIGYYLYKTKQTLNLIVYKELR